MVMCQPPASIGYVAVPSVTAARAGTAHSPLQPFHDCDPKQKTNIYTEHWRSRYTRRKAWSIYIKCLNTSREHTTSHRAQSTQGAFLPSQISFHCEENFLPFQAFCSKSKNRNPITPGLSAGRWERVRTEGAVLRSCLGHNLCGNSESPTRNVTFSDSFLLGGGGRAATLCKSSRGGCAWALLPEGPGLGVVMFQAPSTWVHLVDSWCKRG